MATKGGQGEGRERRRRAQRAQSRAKPLSPRRAVKFPNSGVPRVRGEGGAATTMARSTESCGEDFEEPLVVVELEVSHELRRVGALELKEGCRNPVPLEASLTLSTLRRVRLKPDASRKGETTKVGHRARTGSRFRDGLRGCPFDTLVVATCCSFGRLAAGPARRAPVVHPHQGRGPGAAWPADVEAHVSRGASPVGCGSADRAMARARRRRPAPRGGVGPVTRAEVASGAGIIEGSRVLANQEEATVLADRRNERAGQ